MRLLAGIAELVAPTRCAGCDAPGTLLCPACDATLPRVARETACPRCGAPFGGLVCTECWHSEHSFSAAIAAGSLDGGLARAVVLYKDSGERRLAHVLGALLAREIACAWPGWADAVTWVPPTREALTRRGFDHCRRLAEPVAHALRAPAVPMLERTSAADQRALGRRARVTNAAGTFAVVEQAPPGRVLVVDDVLTTGATLDAAAAALLEAGSRDVRVAVVARAW